MRILYCCSTTCASPVICRKDFTLFKRSFPHFTVLKKSWILSYASNESIGFRNAIRHGVGSFVDIFSQLTLSQLSIRFGTRSRLQPRIDAVIVVGVGGASGLGFLGRVEWRRRRRHTLPIGVHYTRKSIGAARPKDFNVFQTIRRKIVCC